MTAGEKCSFGLGELRELYPTVANLCGLQAPPRIQGKDISRMLDDPSHQVREAAFSVAPMRRGFLLREDRYAFIQYGEKAENGMELFDVQTDPSQFTNLAQDPDHADVVARFRKQMTAKLQAIRTNDLGIDYSKKKPKPKGKPKVKTKKPSA